MNGWRRAWWWVGGLAVIAGGAPLGAEPLRARLGAGSAVMVVQGLDARGDIRLVPEGGEGGEARLPRGEARGLRFVLPDDYRRAQQLAYIGRSGEAVWLLRRFVPALVPYAGIEGSNATAAVRFYLSLLIDEQAWPDALAVAGGLPWAGTDAADATETNFLPDVVRLARGLQSAHRMTDLSWVLGLVPVPAEVVEAASRAGPRVQLRQLADELRRDGHWAEAQGLYEKLRAGAGAEAAATLDLLVAYTEWQRGNALRAEAALAVRPRPAVRESDGVLYRLLNGRVQLEQGDAAGALDELSEALVGAPTANEWRVELTAVIASAYRAQGHPEVAARIEAELRRAHPHSRWAVPESS